MNIASKFELHYFLVDDAHSMDAGVRNKCESEILALVREVSGALSIDIQIEAEALAEGGLRNCWKFLGKNSPQVAVIISIVALLLQIKQLYTNEHETDIELKKLSIEEKQLNIQKLKRELDAGKISDKALLDATHSINLDYRVLTRKSNFYKQLDGYSKITGLGITQLTIGNLRLAQEVVIPKAEFFRYVLSNDALPDQIIEDAEIEIISPVIKEGKYRWKGIYNDEPISFAMNDKNFKDDVLAKRVSFQHGAIIQCVLKIGKGLDEAGDVLTKGYAVQTVISKIDGMVISETSQGKQHKLTKKLKESQSDMFRDNSAEVG